MKKPSIIKINFSLDRIENIKGMKVEFGKYGNETVYGRFYGLSAQ